MLCPRWNSNRIPGPGNTGNSRKHGQSEPVRPMYDPVRRPKCVYCTHPKSRTADSPAHRMQIPTISLESRPLDLPSDQVFLDQDGAALQIDVAGGHSHHQVKALPGTEVVAVTVDPQQQDH